MKRAAAALPLMLALVACGGGTAKHAPQPAGRTATTPIRVRTAPISITLSSPAFSAGAKIPAAYTCSGPDLSPPLRWSGLPAGTRELALELIDRDAPGGAFIHWALAGMAPSLSGLRTGEAVPAGAVAGRNGFGKDGYGGPCPPSGPAHRYVFVLIALASPSGLSPGFSVASLPVSRALALGELEATYARP